MIDEFDLDQDGEISEAEFVSAFLPKFQYCCAVF